MSRKSSISSPRRDRPVERSTAARIDDIQNSDSRFRSFIENLPVLFYAVDSEPPYTPLYVSPAFERFGYPLEAWLEDPDIWVKVIHPDDRDWVFQQTAASTESGEDVDYEYRLYAADGTLHSVRDRGCLIRDDEGNIIYREGVMLDITGRKEAEIALRDSEERYRNLFENANDIIYVHDLEGNYISLNRAAQRVFGYSREEALSLNMTAIVAPECIDVAREKLREKLSGNTDQTAYEIDCFTKEGRRITLEINSTVIRKNGDAIAVQGIARDITDRKVSEEALRESEQRYRDLFENANDLIYTHDLKGNFTSLNHVGVRLTGYTRDEALKMNIAQVVAPESLSAARAMTVRKLANDSSTTYETDIIAKDGRRVSLELSTRLITHKGNPIGVQGVGRDITERRRAEEELKASERRFRQLGEGIFHQVWTAEPNGWLDYVNARTLEYFGRPAEDLIRGGWREVVHPDDVEECLNRWARSVKTGEFFEMEFRLRRHDGVYRWHKARANAGTDQDGKITKWFGTNTDIDDQKQSEAKLNHFARHDPLTDLPNRAEFMAHLQSAIDRGRKNSCASFAVLFLDLDRFKVINDSLGHVIGDKLLKAIAVRLNSLVRPGDVVARLGGDEFTILLNRTGGRKDVITVAERVQNALAEPFSIDSYEVYTSASIGILISDEIMRNPEDFLRDADAAMYRAKESGKARYEVFDAEMHVRNLDLLRIETDLRHAVEREEFELLFQPIVDLAAGPISEFEALIRWRHPVDGLITPDNFIGVAEETGLIVPIGHWVITEACRNIAKWQKEADRQLAVSVNLSAKQLMDPSLIGRLRELLQEHDLDPRQLKFEVTESTVMEHSERSLSVLNQLAAMGISLSTDDFGTGYSSLSYLQRFPFERLKIDRSFIDKMIADEKSAAIVKTILMLGENLGIDVVAEGIENERQLEELVMHGCRLGQGYLLSPPISPAKAGRLLKQSMPEALKHLADISRTLPIFEVANVQ